MTPGAQRDNSSLMVCMPRAGINDDTVVGGKKVPSSGLLIDPRKLGYATSDLDDHRFSLGRVTRSQCMAVCLKHAVCHAFEWERDSSGCRMHSPGVPPKQKRE